MHPEEKEGGQGKGIAPLLRPWSLESELPSRPTGAFGGRKVNGNEGPMK